MENDPVREIAEIILDHRFTARGRCMCGKFQDLDPEKIAYHVAFDIVERYLNK